MKKSVKILYLLIVMSLLVTLAVGCGRSKASSTTATSTAPAEKKLDQVTLTVVSGGDQPDQPGFPAVSDEIAKDTADNINVKLDVQTYAWGDYINKVDTMLAAGQNVDIALTFGGYLQSQADKKQIIPLDELVNQYGADIKAKIPAEIWSDATYKGQIYGVPAIYPFVGIDCLMIRGDLREKYGLPPVTDLATLEQYLDTVTRKEKGMAGFTTYDGGRGYDVARFFLFGEANYAMYFNVETYLPSIMVNLQKPYKAENYFKSAELKKIIDWNKKAYANGWLAKDALIEKDAFAQFQAGKTALSGSTVYNFGNIAPVMEKNIPGCKVEIVLAHDYNNMARISKINNFAAITSTTKNAERAMMFLNWIKASQDNYNLLMYGIKGKDWVTVDDKTYDVGPGIDPAKMPYNPTPWWFKDMNMDLNLKSAHPEYVKFYNTMLAGKYTTPKLIDFIYVSNGIKAQNAQINTAMLEKLAPVLLGVKTSDADYQDALAALDKAGMPDVLADFQKQLDAWAAANDK